MVVTIKERLDKESVMLAGFPFWLSVIFRPLAGSQVPIYKIAYVLCKLFIRHLGELLQEKVKTANTHYSPLLHYLLSFK